jgi:CTP-dependent riboflavin kinase
MKVTPTVCESGVALILRDANVDSAGAYLLHSELQNAWKPQTGLRAGDLKTGIEALLAKGVIEEHWTAEGSAWRLTEAGEQFLREEALKNQDFQHRLEVAGTLMRTQQRTVTPGRRTAPRRRDDRRR